MKKSLTKYISNILISNSIVLSLLLTNTNATVIEGEITPGSYHPVTVDSSGNLILSNSSVSTVTVNQAYYTESDSSSTITLGGTAQSILASSSTRVSYMIFNNDSTEAFCFNTTSTATTSTQGSICIQPLNSYYGESINAISGIAATTGHKYTIKTKVRN